MNALEIAREFGRRDLFTILTPTIFHDVLPSILAALQSNFHSLIEGNLIRRGYELANLRLPDLLVLTEPELPVIWFPLKSRMPLQRESLELQREWPNRNRDDALKRIRVSLSFPF